MFSLGMTGTSTEMVVVPNVEGTELELAAHVLRNAGLQPQGSSAALSARVSRQEPRPGFQVLVGSVVTLFVDGQSRIASQPPNVGLPSSTIASQNSRAVVQSSRTDTATPPLAAGQMWGTQVTVTPLDPNTATVQGQSQIQAGTRQELQPVLLYEPLQPRLTPYFAQNQTQRFYPAWYPRQFIPASASTTPTVMTTQQYSQFTEQSLLSPYTATVTQTTPQTFMPAASNANAAGTYYPALDAWSDGTSYIQTSKPVGLIQTSNSPAVSVPYVVRLQQQDAMSALTKAGLLTGTPTLVDSAQVRSGCVVRQLPDARQLVPAGTQIQLWIAR